MPKKIMNTIWIFLHDLFWDKNHNLRKWFVFGTTLLIPIWGIILTYQGNDNSEQIGVLNKILITSDSTYKSTRNLNELPVKLSQLSSVLDTLSSTLLKETKKLEKSYGTLDSSSALMFVQQKKYLEKISEIVTLSNTQIKELGKNNELVNKHFSRRSKISIVGDLRKENKKYYLDNILIRNAGNVESEISSLQLFFLDELICPDTISNHVPFFTRASKGHYVLNTQDLYPKKVDADFGLSIPMKGACYFKEKPTIVCLLKYINQFESGTFNDTINLRVP
ncbi:MAG: hypothetical protein KA163_02010 [Bacteroidia bacterium]|nr:hypothetical protein [Bacteroidia bacterium]